MNLVEDISLSSLRSSFTTLRNTLRSLPAYYSGQYIICWEIPLYKKVVFLIASERKKWGSYYHHDTIWCMYGGKCVYKWE